MDHAHGPHDVIQKKSLTKINHTRGPSNGIAQNRKDCVQERARLAKSKTHQIVNTSRWHIWDVFIKAGTTKANNEKSACCTAMSCWHACARPLAFPGPDAKDITFTLFSAVC